MRPKKDSLSGRLRVGSFQGSLDILNGNNVFFSRIEVSYDCHVGLLLLSISSLSPHDEWSNGFKIKGKRAVLPPDAVKSRLRRVASPDVQILLKKMFYHYVPLQFPYIIKFGNKII